MKKFKRRSARTDAMHFYVLIRRYFRQIFTKTGTLIPLLLEAPVMLFIVYITCRKNAFFEHNYTQANLIIFMLVVMSAFMGLLNSYREICKEREVLSREVYGGLDINAYVISKVVALSIIGAVQNAFLFGGSMLFVKYGFKNPFSDAMVCFLSLALVNICMTALGLFISAVVKSSESAVLPVLLIIIMQVVFCDSLISLTGAVGYLKYLTPSAYAVAVFGKVCNMNTWVPEQLKKAAFDSNVLWQIIALLLFIGLFIFLTILVVKRRYRQKD